MIPNDSTRYPAAEPVTTAQSLPSGEFMGHKLVAESNVWELFLKEETVSVIIRSKATGEYMTSTVLESVSKDNAKWKGFYQSGVVMEYIKGTNNDYTSADFISHENQKEYTWLTDGFSVKISFPEVSISYELIVRLSDEGFSAEIPQSSIVEGNSEYTVGSFYIFPFLGNTYLGQDKGYMIIPDGQGIIVNLEDNEHRYSQAFTNYIYGFNWGIDSYLDSDTATYPEEIIMPVYGMVHSDKKIAYLGVVEWGDTSCKIEAYPNGTQTDFDWITSRYILRQSYRQPAGKNSTTIQMLTDRANRVDMKVRFIFTEGEEANYAGLAVKYRDYLDKNGTFAKADDLTYKTEVDFFGMDQKDWALFKLDVPMTKFTDAADILEELHEKGVGSVLSVYSGWQKKGVNNLPNMSLEPAGSLGGTSGVKSLLKTMSKYSDSLYFTQNTRNLNSSTNSMETLNAMKRATRETFFNNWSGFYMVNPFRALDIAKSAVKSYSKIDGLGLSIVGTSDFLSCFSYQSTYYDRADNASIYYEMTRTFSDSVPTILDYAYKYLWSQANALTYIPIGGSGYIFASQEIPFLSIVLSGKMPFYTEYVNFEANQINFLLKMIEQAARPAFLITKEDSSELLETSSSDIYSSRYDLYVDKIVEYDAIFSDLYEKINGSSITKHDRIGNLVRVTYSNGLKVYVNYSDEAISLDGVEIPSTDFKVVMTNG